MWNLSEYKINRNRLADFLPWAFMASDGILYNKNGSFQRSYEFRGPDLKSSTQHELISACARVNNAFKRLGSGWAVFIESQRTQAVEYPVSQWPNVVSEMIDAERRGQFQKGESHYENKYFLTLCYLTTLESVVKLQNRMVENSASNTTNYEQQLGAFTTETGKAFDILKGVFPFIRPLTADECLTYLHSTVSTKKQKVLRPLIPAYLDAFITDDTFVGGLEPRLGDMHLRVITIRFFPVSSFPGILDDLNRLPMEYRWMNRFIPLDKLQAERELTKMKTRWFAKRKGVGAIVKETIFKEQSQLSDSVALQQSNDADAALQELGTDLISFGYYTSVIVVSDKTTESVNLKAREVERIINSRGFTCYREDMQAVQAWLGSIPGQCNANVRIPMLSSISFAHIMPISAVWAGPTENKRLAGPPLMYTRTEGNTPFRFSHHFGDVGHMLIPGPTGSGKSVLLTLIETQFQRYKDAQIFIFDKGGSSMAMTYGLGGDWYALGVEEGGSDLQFQPLQYIDQEVERIWAAEWIEELCVNEKMEVNAKLRENIWRDLILLSGLPQKQRTLSGLFQITQDERLASAIKTYTFQGPYGYLLDADKDNLSVGSFLCFEMEKLMDTPHVLPPVLSYLFHRLDQKFTGKPTLLLLDEAWVYLSNPIFVKKIKDWLITARKKNVSVIFATASLATVADNPITATLLESCPTRVYLPNPQAQEPLNIALYKKFGLNDVQIQILAFATPKKEYYFTSPDGNRLFDLQLGPLALAFCGSSTPEDRKLVKQLVNEHGKEAFSKKFLEAKEVLWPAN
jgi:type IV secretion system protein VirB4